MDDWDTCPELPPRVREPHRIWLTVEHGDGDVPPKVAVSCPDCDARWPGDPFEVGAWESMAAWWKDHRTTHVLLGTED